MLTSKVGETLINCFDGKYDKYTLKMWSDKNILRCPVCNNIYEYCHGEYVSPYFRHKEKECKGYFSESETEEHIQGKIKIYNWIKEQPGVTNCKLEAWIPETKQRPDIYFEYEGKMFVIEFQCTPIASEYYERQRLYELNNIKTFWIIGIEKYNLKVRSLGKGKFTSIRSSRFKRIEKELSNEGLIYFDVIHDAFVFHKSYLINHLEFKNPYDLYGFSSKDVNFLNHKLMIREESITHLRKREQEKIGGLFIG